MNELELLLGQVYSGGGQGGGGGGESTIAWKPTVDTDGNISWNRTSSTTKPATQNIKGEKGDTGATGEKGADGAKGDKGDDGYSPTITVTDITGGHRVTITDATGSQSFDVMDGQGGGSGTVDQTYDATSTNAQSGTAVAEAIATVDSSTTFDVVAIPQGPTGANEVNAVLSNKDNEYARLSYVRQSDGTLPNTVNFGVKSGLGDDSFELPTKAYVNSKALTPTGWGVVRTGVATVEFNNSKWSSSATVDVSDLGFSSGADYDVVAQPTTGGTATPWGNAVAFVNANKGASSFSVSAVTMEESLSGTVNIKYTIFAKGYGAVAYTGEIPTGGTTGQVLTKRSNADGDYGWQNNTYVVDKPEGSNPKLGSVVQVGDFVNTDGTEYGIYEFYYRTSALPAADATKTYPFTPLLDDYTIFDFIDQSGMTSNGHVISSGRTDGENRIIIQQFSKNNKNVTIRAYGDFTKQIALLRIKFIGTKNA